MRVGSAALELIQREIHRQFIASRGLCLRQCPRDLVAAGVQRLAVLDKSQSPADGPKAFREFQFVLHLGLVRSAPQRQPALPEPFQRLLMLGVALRGPIASLAFRSRALGALTEPRGRFAQQRASAAGPIDKKALLGVLVAEHIQHAGRHRDRLLIQRILQKRLDLGLGEIFLEGAALRQHAVAKAPAARVVLVAQHHRHHQQGLGQRPGARQRFQALIEVLDDVDDKAQVDDVGRRDGVVRRVERVPARCRQAVLQQPAQVVATPAAIVEQPIAAVQKTMSGQALHRRREAVAHHRGEMPRGIPARVQRCVRLCIRSSLIAVVITQRQQPVAVDAITPLAHQRLPLALIADAGGVVEQADGFRRGRQRGVLGMPGMIRRQQQLLAVQDRRIQRIDIGAIADLAGRGIEAPALAEHREGVIEEIGVIEQRNLAVGVETHNIELRAARNAGRLLRRSDRTLPSRVGFISGRLQRRHVQIGFAANDLARHLRSFKGSRLGCLAGDVSDDPQGP